MDTARGQGRGADGVEGKEESGWDKVHRQEAREKSDTAKSGDEDMRGESWSYYGGRCHVGNEGEHRRDCDIDQVIYTYTICYFGFEIFTLKSIHCNFYLHIIFNRLDAIGAKRNANGNWNARANASSDSRN